MRKAPALYRNYKLDVITWERNMKNKVFQIRASPEDIKGMRDTAAAGAWTSVADMIRDLVKEASVKQSQQLPRETEQAQHDLHDGEPQL